MGPYYGASVATGCQAVRITSRSPVAHQVDADPLRQGHDASCATAFQIGWKFARRLLG